MATLTLSIYKPAGDYQHRSALDIYPTQDTLSAHEGNGETETISDFKTDTGNPDETKK